MEVPPGVLPSQEDAGFGHARGHLGSNEWSGSNPTWETGVILCSPSLCCQHLPCKSHPRRGTTVSSGRIITNTTLARPHGSFRPLLPPAQKPKTGQSRSPQLLGDVVLDTGRDTAGRGIKASRSVTPQPAAAETRTAPIQHHKP